MNRYVKINKETKQVISARETTDAFTVPAETQHYKWHELDSSFDGYLVNEIIVNDDYSITPDTDKRDERLEREKHIDYWNDAPSIRKHLYALYKDRKGDSSLLTEVDSEMDNAEATHGEDTYLTN